MSDAPDFPTPIPLVLEAFQNGETIVILGDADPARGVVEGYLATPAQMITPAKVNFMAREGRGLVCLALTRQRASQLELAPLGSTSPDRGGGAFTVSIEAREGVTTGISAADRARTIAVAVDGTQTAEALVTPGHVFPIVVSDGGVLTEPACAEAAVDLARLGGVNASAVLCRILDGEGEVAGAGDLAALCATHGLKALSVRQLIAYRMAKDNLIEIGARSQIANLGGSWRARAVRNTVTGQEAMVMKLMDGAADGVEPLVEHCEVNILQDLLQGLWQPSSRIAGAMERVAAAGRGAVVVTFLSIYDSFASADAEPDPAAKAARERFVEQIVTQIILN